MREDRTVHYVHLLGLVQRRQYPARMAAQMKQDVMRLERFKEQFAFLREHDLTTPSEVRRFIEQAESEITELEQRRMLANVEKKKRKALYDALGDVEALAPARELYAEGMTGLEGEFRQYLRAVDVLKSCGVSRETLTAQKAEDYRVLAEINLKLKEKRRERKLAKAVFCGIRGGGAGGAAGGGAEPWTGAGDGEAVIGISFHYGMREGLMAPALCPPRSTI